MLSEVYDPCCRDKGISVVDMGLLHHAEIDDGAARVELMLTSGWCPFAVSVLTDVESAVAVAARRGHRQVDAGLGRGMDTGTALGQRPYQAAIPPGPGHVATPRRTSPPTGRHHDEGNRS